MRPLSPDSPNHRNSPALMAKESVGSEKSVHKHSNLFKRNINSDLAQSNEPHHVQSDGFSTQKASINLEGIRSQEDKASDRHEANKALVRPRREIFSEEVLPDGSIISQQQQDELEVAEQPAQAEQEAGYALIVDEAEVT